MRMLLSLCVFTATLFAFGEESIREGHPHYSVIEAARNQVRAAMAIEDLTRPVFEPTVEFNAESAKDLFKGGRYYAIRYDMQATEKGNGRVSLALGLGFTLAVFGKGDTATIGSYGENTDFGALLAKRKIKLLTDADAETIACALHQLSKSTDGIVTWPNRKISDVEWRLSIQTIGDRMYYYQIKTTPEGVVLNGKLCSEEIEKEKK